MVETGFPHLTPHKATKAMGIAKEEVKELQDLANKVMRDHQDKSVEGPRNAVENDVHDIPWWGKTLQGDSRSVAALSQQFID